MSIIGEGLEILGLIDKAKNADVYRQLGDYIDKVREQQVENDKLHTEIRQLKEELRFKASIERIDGHTFVQGDDEEICPSCAAVNNRPVHLEPMRSDRPPYQKATCPACKTPYLHNVPVKRAPRTH
jgi:hypothetical protein